MEFRIARLLLTIDMIDGKPANSNVLDMLSVVFAGVNGNGFLGRSIY